MATSRISPFLASLPNACHFFRADLQVSTIVTAAAADLRLRPSTHRLELGLAASDFTIGRPAQVVGSPGVATNIRGQNSDGAKGGSM